MSVSTRERADRAGPEAASYPPRRSRLRTASAVAVVVLLALGLGRLADLVPSLRNPFTTETVDRSQPAVLKAVEDLSRYQAALGQFQVIIDLEEDARFMPDFIRGERTLFLAAGTVDATVDFSALGTDAITVSPDGDGVTLALPRARLSAPRIDPEASHVVSRQRGLLDRLGGVFSDSPTGERQLYLLAERKLAAAAREAGVVARAETNTRAMLQSMFRSLGFKRVTVTFGTPTPAQAEQ